MPTIPCDGPAKKPNYSRTAMAEDFATLTKMSKTLGKQVVDMLMKNISEALVRGETIDLGEIGRLEVKVRSAREGRNPRTGEPIHLPEKKTIVHAAGKNFIKKVLNAKAIES